MKLITALAALAAVLTAEATTLYKRQNAACEEASFSMSAYDRPFVYPLFSACKDELGDSVAAKENPWVNQHCVAAAVAASVSKCSTFIE